jgi:hypothetical protein
LDLPDATARGIGTTYAYFGGTNEDTPIHNISFKKWGTLAGLVTSVTFIHDNFVPKVRRAFIYQMRQIVDDKTNLVAWKKFSLLPVVLFTTTDRAELRDRLDTLQADGCKWCNFRLGRFKHKQPPQPRDQVEHPFPRSQLDNEILDKEWTSQQLRAKRYLEHQNLSSAMRALMSDSAFVVPTKETLQKLRDKHPAASKAGLTEAQLQEIQDAVVEEAELVKVSLHDVRRVIRKAANLKAPGLDLLRFEHLKQLIGKGPEPAPGDETVFCDLLAKIIDLLIAGEVPAQVLPAFRDNVLCPLPKGEQDIRPIGMGALYRKIASKILEQYGKTFSAQHFGAVQDAFKPDAIANIVHAFNFRMQEHPEHTVWLMDAENAFNRGNRYLFLHETLEHCKFMFPFMRLMYNDESQGFVCGLKDGIEGVTSSEGFHQGDVLGTWAFCMTIQPLLNGLQNFLVQEFGNAVLVLIKFFVDDGNVSAPHPVLLKIIDYFLEEGPKYGYFISKAKGAFLLGKCASPEEAELQRLDLCEKGFFKDIIKIHPDNVDGVAQRSRAERNYGAKMLGSFIGHPAYIRSKLREYISDELHVAAERLKSYPDLQGRWILFSRCWVHKPIHLFRTIPPRISQHLFGNFERMKKEIIMSLMGYSKEDRLDETVYNSCNFAIEDGGLGFYMAEEIAPAAYLASVSSFSRCDEGKSMQVGQRILDAARDWQDVDETKFTLVSSFVRNVSRLSSDLKNNKPDLAECSLQEICGWLLSFVPDRDKGTVQSWLTQTQAKDRLQQLMTEMDTDKKRKKWFVDLQNLEAGLWLRDVPKKGHGFSNAEFRTALRHRLYLPVFGYLLGSKCTCKHKPGLDREGLHLVSGCNSEGKMTDTHNAVTWALETKLKWMGYVTKREERGTFLTGDENDHGRSDISIFNPPFGSQDHKKHLLDIRVSAVLEGSKSGWIKTPKDADVNKKLFLAQAAYNAKINTYEQRAHQSGCGFSPIIFMSTGGVHEESKKKILQFVTHASGNVVSIPKRTLYLSTMRACSVALQKGVATSINIRTKSCNDRILSQATRVDSQIRRGRA